MEVPNADTLEPGTPDTPLTLFIKSYQPRERHAGASFQSALQVLLQQPPHGIHFVDGVFRISITNVPLDDSFQRKWRWRASDFSTEPAAIPGVVMDVGQASRLVDYAFKVNSPVCVSRYFSGMPKVAGPAITEEDSKAGLWAWHSVEAGRVSLGGFGQTFAQSAAQKKLLELGYVPRDGEWVSGIQFYECNECGHSGTLTGERRCDSCSESQDLRVTDTTVDAGKIAELFMSLLGTTNLGQLSGNKIVDCMRAALDRYRPRLAKKAPAKTGDATRVLGDADIKAIRQAVRNEQRQERKILLGAYNFIKRSSMKSGGFANSSEGKAIVEYYEGEEF